MEDNDKESFLGRFQLLAKMSQGGMATLYLGRLSGPERFQKLLVIKKIHEHLASQRQFVEMLMDEARIAALIQHPNVGSIFELGMAGNVPFIAMEYIHGHNLAEMMDAIRDKQETMAWTHAARIVSDAAAGLHAAHELTGPEGESMKVVHRDVSPQNILVSYEGQVKVVDFGVAYAAGKIANTAEGTLKGKIPYMSPEQAEGRVLDRRSDVFSLGVVLWECLTLKRLFDGENEAATLQEVLKAEVVPPILSRPDIPKELSEITMKALARDRDKRIATAGEFGEALDELLSEKGVAVTPKQLARVVSGLFEEQKKEKDVQLKTVLSDGPLKKDAEEKKGEPSSDAVALADTVAHTPGQLTAPTVAGRRVPEPEKEEPEGEPDADPVPIELRRKPTKRMIPLAALEEPDEPKERRLIGPVVGGIVAVAVIAFVVIAWIFVTRIDRPGKGTGKQPDVVVLDLDGGLSPGDGDGTVPLDTDAVAADAVVSSDSGGGDAGPADAGPAPDAAAAPIPQVRMFDLTRLTPSCRKLYTCLRHRIALAPKKGHSLINDIMVITSRARDRTPGAESKCRRHLLRATSAARLYSHRWPSSCGGRVDISKRLPRLGRLSDAELCGRAIHCCLALNRRGAGRGGCRTHRRMINDEGPAYCQYIWVLFEDVLRTWARKGIPRPPECKVPK